MPGPAFTPAAELSGRFYVAVVRPLLAGRPHAAALLGGGSDVLGHDTPRSTDHGWGPRLLVLLDDPREVPACRELIDARLPEHFAGWPTRFGWDDVAPRHHVEVTTLADWLTGFLGVDASAGMSTLDWLLTPQQRLLGVVAGRVHADDSGSLRAVRESLRWYPDQLERWFLACQWHRIAQEEAFVARTAEVGDEVGSAVVAARLVRDLMRLALLLDRQYAPYSKWLGTAFAAMTHPDDLPGHLTDAVHAPDDAGRESALADAYRALAHRQNARGLVAPLHPAITAYHRRPAQVLMADRFAEAIRASIADPGLRSLPLLGSVDQAVDSADILSDPVRYRRLAALYGDLRT
ncbi:protein of unknown function [Modestobacter sp. DSM 44400]|uniref:DUF4037 domain-containing protein n=1 Tax=Modestobacter sp. DSM 44400 TaxID=1550230 RepID=UPI00089CA7EF|nr:DUF4037 domain-containing protein [Modestobacter sp. DSM 44400]SDY13694.1 protein of unknown function [Modestobacter sp. DSM 44400]